MRTLILVLSAAGLIGATGLILFVVGLAKRRAGLWGTGVAVGVLTAVLLAVGFEMAEAVAQDRWMNQDIRADDGQAAKAHADFSGIAEALDAFKADFKRYPTDKEGLQALVEAPPGLAGWRGPYLKAGLPVDSWRNDYVYRCPGWHRPARYDLYSRGPDGKADTSDDIGNWTTK